MSSSESLRSLLRTAVNAPSGDNAQPWEFRLQEDAIEIFNKAGADETLYNYKQRGSYLSHGALIENISLLSQKLGLQTNVALFPPGAGAVARLTFSQGRPFEDELCRAIPERSTNRKPYHAQPLKNSHREKLITSISGDVAIHLIEGAEVKGVAGALSLNERLLMENRPLHDFLFGMIRWSKREEAERPGLYVETMELPPPVRFMFRHVLRHWPLARVLTALGIGRIISLQTSALYAASSCICVLVIPNDGDLDFVKAGRAFERMWLTAAVCGLSLQPVTGLPYLAQRIRAGEAEQISSKHQHQIMSAVEQVERTCGLSKGATIAMIARLGYGEPPSARSLKLSPIILGQPQS